MVDESYRLSINSKQNKRYIFNKICHRIKNMEAVVEKAPEQIKEPKSELKSFRAAFIIFLIGQIFLIVSTLTYAANINGVPRFFRFFDLFVVVTNVLDWVALFLLRKVNKSFRYSFYSVSIFLVLLIVYSIAMSSSESMYVAIGRGLSWSKDIVQAVFYIYFFHGCYLFFEKQGFNTGKKVAYISIFIFLGLFITSCVLTYLITVRPVQRNFVLYRIFLYSGWGFKFLIYAFTFVIVLRAGTYLQSKYKAKKKKEKDGEGKVQDISD